MARVANKVVLLTGVANSVVQMCAQALIDEGARIIMVDADATKAEQAASALDGPTDSIIWLAKDVA